jgi:hypothetical protein
VNPREPGPDPRRVVIDDAGPDWAGRFLTAGLLLLLAVMLWIVGWVLPEPAPRPLDVYVPPASSPPPASSTPAPATTTPDGSMDPYGSPFG